MSLYSNQKAEVLETELSAHFGETLTSINCVGDEVTIAINAQDLTDVCLQLRDEAAFLFSTLIDVCGVDYLSYGDVEWNTTSASNSGFSRGVQAQQVPEQIEQENRYESVYHFLSLAHNRRLRLVVRLSGPYPKIASVVDIWAGANWFEREAFDMFGIMYEGHPDLRRILTDYGFVGHPFRKDFPLIGNVEVLYDEEKKRVVYQPVSIKPRVLVPKVIRDDSRYTQTEAGESNA